MKQTGTLFFTMTLTLSSFLGLGASVEASTFKEFHVPDASGAEAALKVFRWVPDGYDPGKESRPAVLLFHGGGWKNGGPGQMSHFASEFADAGYVAYSASYRLVGTTGETVADCVADAEAVYQWLLDNAAMEGIDSQRMFVGGASAGGHLALCLFLRPDGEGESRFQGYLGYNPVVTSQSERFEAIFEGFGTRFDPVELLSDSAAPMLIFHGHRDTVVPIETVQALQSRAETLDVRCALEVFEGVGHGFFNKNRASPEIRERLRSEAIHFLNQLSDSAQPTESN